MVCVAVLRRLLKQENGPTPFYIPARDLTFDPLPSVAHVIRDRLTRSYQCQASESDVVGSLSRTPTFIIIDGLDEIFEPWKRAELVASLAAFVERFPSASVLVACRPAGFNSAGFVLGGFVTSELCDFNDEQSVALFARLTKTGPASSGLGRDLALPVRGWQDGPRSPFFVALAAEMLRYGVQFGAATPYAVLRDWVQLALGEWDQRRGIGPPVHAHLEPVLREVALQMAERDNRDISLGQLEGLLQIASERNGFSPVEAETQADLLVSHLAGRSFLLTEVGIDSKGDPLFSFSHRTVYEYLLAEALVRRARGTDAIADELRPFLTSSGVAVVRLALVAVEYSYLDGADQTLRTLAEEASPDQLPLIELLRSEIAAWLETNRE